MQYWDRKTHSQMLFETLQEGESTQDLTGVMRRVSNLHWKLNQKVHWFSVLWYVTVMLQPFTESSTRNISSLILPHLVYCTGRSLELLCPRLKLPWLSLAGALRFPRLPAGWSYFQKVSSSQWTSRSPEALSWRALGGSNYTLIICEASAEQGQASVPYFGMPAVLKPGPFLTEPSKWMLARSTIYTCIQLSKVLRLKLHIVNWCNLCLSQKESLRLHLPIFDLNLLWAEMKLRVFRCWLLRNCFLNVSYLWSQLISLFEALLKKQNTLKCFYLKISSGTWWMKNYFLFESRNKNGYFFSFLSSALLFNKSSSWSPLLHLPAFVFPFFKKVLSRRFGRKAWQYAS